MLTFIFYVYSVLARMQTKEAQVSTVNYEVAIAYIKNVYFDDTFVLNRNAITLTNSRDTEGQLFNYPLKVLHIYVTFVISLVSMWTSFLIQVCLRKNSFSIMLYN